jgi:hypothetical protein
MFHGCYGQKIVAPPTMVSLGGLLRLRCFRPLPALVGALHGQVRPEAVAGCQSHIEVASRPEAMEAHI